jgi:hypothetical protein
MFTLAFENSEEEEDYVTKKFFQALEAGTIPVALGAQNICDFAPLPDMYLHLGTLTGGAHHESEFGVAQLRDDGARVP